MIAAAEVATATDRGPAHTRQGTPTEDAAAWTRADDGELMVAAAVADGHGDQRCFRSADGARFAVRAALDAALARGAQQGDPLRLAADAIDRWRVLVDNDRTVHPLTDSDLAELDASRTPGARAEIDANPRLVYGTTLILCVVLATGVTVIQVGDGDAIVVARDGHAMRLLADDPTAPPGRTSSLSQPNAESAARSRSLEFEQVPALVLLATDGVGDAYPDDSALLRAGSELLVRSRTSGRVVVRDELAAWVAAAAVNSGDDATAAVIWVDALPTDASGA